MRHSSPWIGWVPLAADIHRVLEPLALQQPAYRDDLGLVLIIPAGPVIHIVEARIVVECGPVIQAYLQHDDPPDT